MQFKFIPNAYKENPFKSCLFFDVEDMLGFLNNPEFVSTFCGLDTNIGAVTRSSVEVKPCSTPFTVAEKTFSHEVYVNNTLIGYANFDFMYDEFKENNELSKNEDVQKVIKFAQDNSCEDEALRELPLLKAYGKSKEKAFLIAGQRYSVHQWLESLIDGSDVNKADYQVVLDNITLTLDPIPTVQSFAHPEWSLEHPQIYTKFLEMLSALNRLVQTKHKVEEATA